MTPRNDEDVTTTTADTVAAQPNQRMQIGLRMKADAHSDQPVFSNFTTVQGAPGVVFVDFGFLEPTTLPGIARLAQAGGKMPGSIDGRLACRVVLGMDSAAQLAQQLNQHLKKVAPKAPSNSKSNKAAN